MKLFKLKPRRPTCVMCLGYNAGRLDPLRMGNTTISIKLIVSMDPESLRTLTIDTFKVVITVYSSLLTNILLILMRTSKKQLDFNKEGLK